jgi:hypothetical protein
MTVFEKFANLRCTGLKFFFLKRLGLAAQPRFGSLTLLLQSIDLFVEKWLSSALFDSIFGSDFYFFFGVEGL